jgi:murein L,D-transpeptidase YafK
VVFDQSFILQQDCLRSRLFHLAALILSGCLMLGYNLAWSERPVPAGSSPRRTARRPCLAASILIRVFKQEGELELWKMGRSGRYELSKTDPICRWSEKLGPKTIEGDHLTPEGFYAVAPPQMYQEAKPFRVGCVVGAPLGA